MGSPTCRAPAIGRGKTDARVEGIINSKQWGSAVAPPTPVPAPASTGGKQIIPVLPDYYILQTYHTKCPIP